MPLFPNDRSNDPNAKIGYGRDFNFFRQVTPQTSGAGVFATDADAFINLNTPTYTVIFWVPNGTRVQYSFNGFTVHGDLDGSGALAPNTLTFQNRVISKIWFSYLAGSGTVRVEAWGIR
jgi:hypothetical protein